MVMVVVSQKNRYGKIDCRKQQETAPAQTIRIEQAPMKIGFASTESNYKM